MANKIKKKNRKSFEQRANEKRIKREAFFFLYQLLTKKKEKNKQQIKYKNLKTLEQKPNERRRKQIGIFWLKTQKEKK